MRDQDAIELIDAHLDDEQLTDQQAEALAEWLRGHPQRAEQAFHRIFLHTFLRRRLHAQRLAPQSVRNDLIKIDILDQQPSTELLVTPLPAEAESPPSSSSRFLYVCLCCGALSGFVAVAGLLLWLTSASPPATPLVYEGFDYPATSIPAPPAEPRSWPTTGGLQGLDGGYGWAGPWQEAGPKVAVIVDHVHEENWDPKDMRKFRPLSHTDSRGHTLKTTGLQMRTAMGVRSITSRKLDLDVFPEPMRDETGLGQDGCVIWFSFLAQSFNSTAENNRFTYFQIGSREISGFRLGKVGAAPSGNWTATGLLTGAQVNLRSSTVPSGEMALLVTRLEFRPGPEEAAVWINPGLTVEPSLARATLRLSVPDFRFDGITVNANFSTDIDEIRFGQTFREVAPVR